MDEVNNIPLVDDDAAVSKEDEEEHAAEVIHATHDVSHPLETPEQSEDKDSSSVTSDSASSNKESEDMTLEELEEKARLISQVLELQSTLDDLSHRVDVVKEENLKLRSENQVLGQYIENLMSASSIFQSTSSKAKK